MGPRGNRRAEEYAGVCGVYWEGCPWYEALPFTCSCQQEVLGEAACPVRLCAARRRVEKCALCVHFPCALLFAFAARSRGEDLRIFSAARRAEYGEQTWALWAREQLPHWLDAYCPLRDLPKGNSRPRPVGQGHVTQEV